MKLLDALMKFPAILAFADKLAHIWIVYRYENRREEREKLVDGLQKAQTDEERMQVIKNIADSFKRVV